MNSNEQSYEKLHSIVYAAGSCAHLEIISRLSMLMDDLLAPQAHQQNTADDPEKR